MCGAYHFTACLHVWNLVRTFASGVAALACIDRQRWMLKKFSPYCLLLSRRARGHEVRPTRGSVQVFSDLVDCAQTMYIEVGEDMQQDVLGDLREVKVPGDRMSSRGALVHR